MPTQCNQESCAFAKVEEPGGGSLRRRAVTSDADALLLGATDRAIRLVRRFATCFCDGRRADLIEHALPTLVGQRVFTIVLGYKDPIDHDELRHDPVPAVLAGRSTLSRLVHAPLGEPERYHKIGHDAVAIEGLFVDLFPDAHEPPSA